MAYLKSESFETGPHQGLFHGSGPEKCSMTNTVYSTLRSAKSLNEEFSALRPHFRLDAQEWVQVLPPKLLLRTH